jgi:hypothetical protein
MYLLFDAITPVVVDFISETLGSVPQMYFPTFLGHSIAFGLLFVNRRAGRMTRKPASQGV